MTKLHHVKKARKDFPPHIKRGMEYWWWAWRSGRSGTIRRMARRPMPWEMTRSPFLRQVRMCQSMIELATASRDKRHLLDELAEAARIIEVLKVETAMKGDNVNEQFRNGCPSLELLNERCESLMRIKNEIDAAIKLVEMNEVAEIGWTVE